MKVPDLANRRILEQVQFCLPGKPVPCSKEGEYFIADFVFVKYQLNPLTNQQEIVDMIIADSKLSNATALTSGQKLAKAGVGGNLNVKVGRIRDMNHYCPTKPIWVIFGLVKALFIAA